MVKEHFDLYSGSNDNIYTIISIGDSDDEYVASKEAKQMISSLNQLNRNNNIVRLHRIKLKEGPTMNEMVKQIATLMKEVEVLLTEKGSMTVHYAQANEAVEATQSETYSNDQCFARTALLNGVISGVRHGHGHNQPQPSK